MTSSCSRDSENLPSAYGSLLPGLDASEWVENYRRYWEDQLDALARYFQRESTPHEPQERFLANERPLVNRGEQSASLIQNWTPILER